MEAMAVWDAAWGSDGPGAGTLRDVCAPGLRVLDGYVSLAGRPEPPPPQRRRAPPPLRPNQPARTAFCPRHAPLELPPHHPPSTPPPQGLHGSGSSYSLDDAVGMVAALRRDSYSSTTLLHAAVDSASRVGGRGGGGRGVACPGSLRLAPSRLRASTSSSRGVEGPCPPRPAPPPAPRPLTGGVQPLGGQGRARGRRR
jgi:hypothetical protein